MTRVSVYISVLVAFLCACGANNSNSGGTGERANVISSKVANYPDADATIMVIDYDQSILNGVKEIKVAIGTIKSDGTLNIEMPENPTETYELPSTGCNFQSFGKGKFLVARYFKITGSVDSLVEVDKRRVENSNLSYPYTEIQRIYSSQATEFVGECGDSLNKQIINLKFKKGWNFVQLEQISERESRQTVVDSSAGFIWRFVYGP